MPKKSGFTLIELMVVISIIAILSIIGLISYTNFLKNSRDAKRQADLKIIQSALESYHADQTYYPTFNGNGVSCDNNKGWFKLNCPLQSLDGSKTYINLIPDDPSGSAWGSYTYQAKPGSAQSCEDDSTKCKTYCLFAKLENPTTSSTLTTDCKTFPSGGYNYLLTPP